MEKQEKILEELKSDVLELVEKELESSAIIGINVGTPEGTKIASIFKKDIQMSTGEVTAANSSLVFLSSKMLRDSLNQEVSYNLIFSKEKIVLSILTENITMITYLNRELAELEGLGSYINKLQKLSLQITAIIETSDILKEEIGELKQGLNISEEIVPEINITPIEIYRNVEITEVNFAHEWKDTWGTINEVILTINNQENQPINIKYILLDIEGYEETAIFELDSNKIVEIGEHEVSLPIHFSYSEKQKRSASWCMSFWS